MVQEGESFMKYYFQWLLLCLLYFWIVGCSESIPSAKTDIEVRDTKSTVRITEQTATNRISPDQIGVKATAFDQTMYDDASLALGGLAYDKWWIMDDLGNIGILPPNTETNHPLWPKFNTKKTNDTTWRCKSCHGWDYRGRKGAYGSSSSSYFTKIKGFIAADDDTPNFTTPADIYAFIDDGQVLQASDHTFGTVATPEVLHALTKFIVTMQEEATAGKEPWLVIDSGTKLATGGDAANGKIIYDMPTEQAPTGGGCDINCHGPDGRAIDFSTDQNKFVDTYAWDNPWEILHKIRFGHPNADPPMPGLVWYDPQFDFQSAIDVLRYTQESLIPSTAGFDVTRYAASRDQVIADFARGGMLWDKWWTDSNEATPLTVPTSATATHELWASSGNTTETNDATWRCKSCHGWDYLGAAGAYGSGDYLTGIKGVVKEPEGTLPNNATPAEVFDIIHSGTVTATGDHGFSAAGIADDDIYALTRFVISVQEEALDGRGIASFMSPAPDPATCDPAVRPKDCYAVVSGGNAGDGYDFYHRLPYDPAAPDSLTQGGCGTTACHGDDGREIIIDETLALDDLARINPQEYIHKVRFGHPGSEMLGTADYQFTGLGLQAAADVTKYSQGGLTRNLVTGGRLFDNWMAEAGLDAPPTRHAIYDLATDLPELADDQTWRCAMCHGWDYQGIYSLWNDLLWLKSLREWTLASVYKSLNEGYPVFDGNQIVKAHNFGDYMGEYQLWSLAEFIVNGGVVNTNKYIRVLGSAYNGNDTKGGMIYSGGFLGMTDLDRIDFDCQRCHGGTGTGISGVDVFASAWQDPWRFFHKIRFGSPMPPATDPSARMFGILETHSMLGEGFFAEDMHPADNQDAMDVMDFAQDQFLLQPAGQQTVQQLMRERQTAQ